ncbi:hypothetical protein CL659_01310 [bacterium]|nr:hypothetical protein [bacterium]
MVSFDKKNNGVERLEMKKNIKKIKLTSLFLALSGIAFATTTMLEKNLQEPKVLISFFAFVLALTIKELTTKKKDSLKDHLPSIILTLFVFSGLFIFAKVNLKPLDLTRNKIRSISEEAKKITKEINEKTEIFAFFDDPYEKTTKQIANKANLESMFEQLSKENKLITYKFINPNREPSAALRFNARENQIYIVQGDKQIIMNTNDEEGLVNALYGFSKDVKNVCFVQGHGEKELYGEEGITAIKNSLLNRAYKIKTLNLYEENESDCEIVAIVGGSGNLLNSEIEKISTIKNLLVIFEGSEQSALSKWLEEEGIEISKNYINDSFEEDFDPLIILSSPNNLTSHPIVENIDEFMLFSTAKSIISKSPKWLDSNLVYSGIQTWIEENGNEKKDEFEKHGPFLIALAQENIEENKKRVIVSDSDIADNIIQQALPISNNFILNIVNWLSDREEMIAVPSKNRDLNPISINKQEILKVVMLYLGLILAVLSQVIVTQVKRKSK